MLPLVFDGRYVSAGCDSVPGKTVKIDPFDMPRVGAAVLEAGEDRAQALTTDGVHLYVGCYTRPVKVVKLNPVSMQQVGVFTGDAGEDNCYSVSRDGSHVYVATWQDPARTIRIDPATMTRVATIELNPGYPSDLTYIRPYWYTSHDTSPGRVTRFLMPQARARPAPARGAPASPGRIAHRASRVMHPASHTARRQPGRRTARLLSAQIPNPHSRSETFSPLTSRWGDVILLSRMWQYCHNEDNPDRRERLEEDGSERMAWIGSRAWGVRCRPQDDASMCWQDSDAEVCDLAIRRLGMQNAWVMASNSMAYVLGVDDQGGLQHLYWGDRLPRDTDYPLPALPSRAFPFESPRSMVYEEYPGWGGIRFSEPCLKVSYPDGVRAAILTYDSHRVLDEGVPELVVTLRDPQYDLVVILHYRLHEDFDIIERYAEIKNEGACALTLEQVLSAAWALPRGTGYRLTYLSGRWAGETQLSRVPIGNAKIVLESRRGLTSHQMNPWFAIDPRERATEERGQVWFGALCWSGNWKIVVEQTALHRLTVSGGINDFDFAWSLGPGETFTTPAFVGGYTTGGFGAASRNLHGYQLGRVLPANHARSPRKVLYNSWEAIGFGVSEARLAELAERAASLGVELFVVDDGWFGERDDDTAGLGDWTVNPGKFPGGLRPLIDRVKALGMDFGIWVEPEMVNPDSDLYRAHPDWVYGFPGRPRSLSRNQLVLNLSNDEVREHIFRCLDALLAENDIKFVKWDANRHFSEPGWSGAPAQREREIWVRHVHAVYDVLDRLRHAHPDVVFESCSGGGGRVDLGILRHADQVWPSDNVDPVDRLWIQEGFSYAYCPKVMMGWVTDSRRRPLAFRFHAAMMGPLGISADLGRWSTDELELARRKIAEYKEIRDIVQHGQLYRVLCPSEECRDGGAGVVAMQYVSRDRDEGVAFVFLLRRLQGEPLPRVRLPGLEPETEYSVTGTGLEPDGIRASGQALASLGIEVGLKDELDSLLVRVRRA